MKKSLQPLNLDHLESILETDFQKGLSSSIAKIKLRQNGFNRLVQESRISLISRVIQQFKDFFTCLLLISAAITLIIGYFNNEKEELYEGFLILSIVIINAFLGIFYEYQKDISLKLIQNKTKPYARVLRDQKIQLVLKEHLVVGDIIFLEIGDIVPADIQLIHSNNLKVNEAILTGETLPIEKNFQVNNFVNLNLLTPSNMVFMHTTIIYGNAKGVVLKTGMQTQIGQIKQLTLKQYQANTPLEKNINQLAQFLSYLIIFLVILNLIINLIKNYFLNYFVDFSMIRKLFLSSIALAVAVIPEGLLTIITIILAFSMRKLVCQKAIVKNLKSLETIGAISVLCTDKTGTLTENQLTIKKIYLFNQVYDVLYDLKSNFLVNRLLNYGILCNSVYINKSNIFLNDNQSFLVSDPVDQSFINLAYQWDFDIQHIYNIYTKVKEFPFDDYYKLMITIHQFEKSFFVLLKGAAEIILRLTDFIFEENRVIPKNSNHWDKLEKELNNISQEGYKILGIAYATLQNDELYFKQLTVSQILKKLSKRLIFVGAVGIEDPVRPHMQKIIQNLKQASIVPIMITGDHLHTAQHVARNLKIIQIKNDIAITGDILDQLNEEEFLAKLPYIKVYARTNHIHKLKIVDAWQKKGKIVGMIGDGVNDAPSIKKADIGISMGITGAEITKQTADVILTDDNFQTVYEAILEGRNIFYNLQKSVLFLLSCNMGEIIVVFLNTCLGHLFFNSNFTILTTFQILWVNLITDSLVAISLGMEPKEDDLRMHKPRNIKKSLISANFMQKIIFEGLMIGILTFCASFVGYKKYNNQNIYGQTFAFMILCFSQLFHVFNLRHFKKSIFQLPLNLYLIISFLISVLLQIIIFIIPFFRNKFRLANLILVDFIIIFLFSITPLIIIEIKKMINKNKIL
ncbi:MAG: cation-transporting P-type ATPase [Vigna little leaf phytoplasma]|nr:cation-transporting P-type ATPase [Vigna little leaf phytoplasma]